MIVDTHTHVWQSLDQLGPQLSALLRARAATPADEVDASPIAHEHATDLADAALVLGLRSLHLGIDIPDELVSRYVTSRPDRLIGFAGVDPMERGFERRLDDLPALKLSGVVVSPASANFHPMHSRAVRLYERCADARLPVIFHGPDLPARDAALQYAQPVLLDEVARSFPDLRILITRCGFPFIDQALMLIAKHPHVWAEISGIAARPWQLLNTLLIAHEMDATDKLMFGSGFPHHDPATMVERLYSVNRYTQGADFPTVPREKVRAIVERDALAALGLKRLSGRGSDVAPARRTAPANPPAPPAPPAPSAAASLGDAAP